MLAATCLYIMGRLSTVSAISVNPAPQQRIRLVLSLPQDSSAVLCCGHCVTQWTAAIQHKSLLIALSSRAEQSSIA